MSLKSLRPEQRAEKPPQDGSNNQNACSNEEITKNLATLVDSTDFYSTEAVLRLDPGCRSVLGQYMTPAPIARFMASLFTNLTGELRVLDPGAGVGSLTAALVERLSESNSNFNSVELVAFEIEPVLTMYLQNTLLAAKKHLRDAQIEVTFEIFKEDFIQSCSEECKVGVFSAQASSRRKFTHVIMNPPYKKISSSSVHRSALRNAGIETSNLYAGFMALAVQYLCEGGELVAIVPRSFCNGAYFKSFRDYFFSKMTLRHIHVFEQRNNAFKRDEVLQENMILHAIKEQRSPKVMVTTSNDGQFVRDDESHEWVGESMTQHAVEYRSIIDPDDSDCMVHVISNDIEQHIADRIAQLKTPLGSLDLSVSTGPVVDFRLKDHLRFEATSETAPLLYPAHFLNQVLEWPKTMKKPNAIVVSNSSQKWLWENNGFFVVTRRVTSKEERRRIVASIYASDLPGPLIGFENHLNVFHVDRRGMTQNLAKGLCIYLNSTLVDRYFRQFNGHTQVSAADLRSLKYPDRETLERWGKCVGDSVPSQQEIDDLIEEEFTRMATD